MRPGTRCKAPLANGCRGMPALDQSGCSSRLLTNERWRLVAGRVEQLPHSVTDSLNGRSSLFLSLSTTNTGWPTPLRQPREQHRWIHQSQLTSLFFSPTTEAPVAETSAEAEAVSEVSNGAAAEEETNGEAAKETTEAETTNGSTEVTNGEEVPASSNGSTEAEKKEETSSEAVKRKAEGEEVEEASTEKIAKLKEVAAEKLNEAEEKLPAEPLTEAEAVA